MEINFFSNYQSQDNYQQCSSTANCQLLQLEVVAWEKGCDLFELMGADCVIIFEHFEACKRY